MRKGTFRLSLFQAILLWCVTVAGMALPTRAEEILASEVEVSTPRYEPEYSEFTPRLGTYTYEVSWQGIPAATATLSIYRKGDQLFLFTSAKTAKFIDIFYKLRYRADGIINAKTFQPKKVAIDHIENSRHKILNFEFERDGLVRAARWYQKGRRDPQEHQLEFTPTNMMLGPFSSAFLARSLNYEVGDQHFFDAFNGKSRYLISFKVIKRGVERFGTRKEKVLVLTPEVKNLTKPESDSKLDYAEIYVTDDWRREIIEIRSKVFIGTVRTKLVSFSPLAPEASLRASLKKSPLLNSLK